MTYELVTNVYCKLLVGVNLFVDLPKVGIIHVAYTKSVADLLPCMAYATDQHH